MIANYNETKLYGVMGDPIQHSKSPLMMNAAFRKTGHNGFYTAFHVRPGQLGDAIKGAKALKFRGLNITIPHKVEVMKYLDELDESARAIGAVNTIVFREGRLIGYNTDGIGYVRSLKEHMHAELQGKSLLVIGAGGAARAIVYGLLKEKPARLFIANRTYERAVQLANDMRAYGNVAVIAMDELLSVREKIDLAVNTTRAGMHPEVDTLPASPSLFRPGMVVSDIVYNPLKTRWLQLAEEAGCRIHDGVGMFVYQGAFAFEYWTGLPAPVKEMTDAVMQSLRAERERR